MKIYIICDLERVAGFATKFISAKAERAMHRLEESSLPPKPPFNPLDDAVAAS